MKNFLGDMFIGWTMYVIHPCILFIKNFIMVEFFNHLTK